MQSAIKVQQQSSLKFNKLFYLMHDVILNVYKQMKAKIRNHLYLLYK